MDGPRTLSELAELVGGELIGDGDTTIDDVAAAEDAGHGLITFAVSKRYIDLVRKLRPSAVLVTEHIDDLEIPQIVHPQPQLAFVQIASAFHYREPVAGGIADQAVVHVTATVEKDATIYPFVFVGARSRICEGARLHAGAVVGEDCVVGPGTVIHPNAVLGDGTRIGRRCVVHACTVIGADGFGYIQQAGVHIKVPHFGTVTIEDDVEIGANCCIDRAVLGATFIGSGTKMDNLVHVGHNCKLGRNVLLIAHAGLSGSTEIGDAAIMGPRSGTADHVKIGAGAIVAGMSGVHKDVPDGATVAGLPAFDGHLWRKVVVAQKRLPELLSRVRDLERRLKKMEES